MKGSTKGLSFTRRAELNRKTCQEVMKVPQQGPSGGVDGEVCTYRDSRPLCQIRKGGSGPHLEAVRSHP